MTKRIGIALIIGAVSVPLAALAGEPLAKDRKLTAEAAYDALKNLEGTWVGEAVVVPMGKAKDEGTKSETKVTYRRIANDSSVMATYLEGTPMEMVSMFHLDGDQELVHTHYCAVGNQPTMRFEPVDEKGVIRFSFAEGTNMDVTKDGHVHGGTIHIIDEDTIETETELWDGGKLSSIRYTRMTRKK